MRPQQWVNAGPDEGAPHALLRRVAEHVAVDTIDELWLFPTRRVSDGESTVAVAAAFEQSDERRRVITFRFVVSRNNRGAARVRDQVFEYGSAPSHAIVRVIEGVLRRLGDETEVPPHGRAIAGDPSLWAEWLVELGAPAVDEAADDASATMPHADGASGTMSHADDASATMSHADGASATMPHADGAADNAGDATAATEPPRDEAPADSPAGPPIP